MKFILPAFLLLLLASCGGNGQEESEAEEQLVVLDTSDVDSNYMNESELITTNEMEIPFEVLKEKFQSYNQLSNEDLCQLRADTVHLEGSDPFSIDYFELEFGQVLVFGYGFVADAVHVTGTMELTYFDHNGVYINTAHSGAIDEYSVFQIQDNFIAVTCEYMEFEEGEYVMESTGNTIYEVEYFVESDGKLRPLKDEENLDVWRNQIFAKHGYIFKNKKYTNIFSDFAWYMPKHENVDHLLTEEEKALADYIRELENK